MMKLFSRALLLLVGGLCLAAGTMPAVAQVVTSDRVQYALDLTDRRIEQARTVTSTAPNEAVRVELDAAMNLQSRARSAFTASQLALALRLTLDARRHADRAIAILRGLPDPDRVVAQLERTREVLDRARDRIEECQNDRARAMLRVAVEMQGRAEAAAEDGRYLAALQLTMSARERAMKALRLCNVQDDLEQGAERAMQRTDEVIARAQDVVGERGGERARQFLARAIDLQAEAGREFQAERYASSLRLTQSARTLAQRAIRLAGGPS